MNLKSIKSKLLIGGVTLTLLPIIVSSVLSYKKSYDALLEQSMKTARSTASDLARLTDKILAGDMYLASSFAAQKAIRDIVDAVNKKGTAPLSKDINTVFVDLKNQFKKLDTHYQGIFVTGKDGILFTGVLDSGKEYKGSNISTRTYFNEAKQTGKTVISEIVRSKSTGKLIVVACSPIISEDKAFAGVFGVVIKAGFFTDLISGRKIGRTGYGYMINQKGLIIAHPNPELILKLDVTKITEMETINQKMLAGESGVERYTFKGIDKLAGFAPVSFNHWSIGATQNEAEVLQVSKQIRNFNIAFVIIAGVAGILIIIYMARLIVRPINDTINGLTDISEGEGDLSKRLEVTTKDEVGQLATVFNAFIDKLQNMISQITSGVGTLSEASGDLLSIAQKMSDNALQTSEKSNTVAAAAEEMSANMNSVAMSMDESSGNTGVVVSAVEEMNSTISEIAKNAENAREITTEAVSKTDDARQQVDELGSSASQISKVVDTITDISEQVNLLALNATIEAARAGEAGKGFAVVANEIKELADQTAEASNDIKEKISGIQGSTEDTVGSIKGISEVVTRINDIVSTIATAVEEQSVTTREISQNFSQASEGLQRVNDNVSQSSVVADEITRDISDVNHSSENMADQSEQVKSKANHMSALAEKLNSLVGRFKL